MRSAGPRRDASATGIGGFDDGFCPCCSDAAHLAEHLEQVVRIGLQIGDPTPLLVVLALLNVLLEFGDENGREDVCEQIVQLAPRRAAVRKPFGEAGDNVGPNVLGDRVFVVGLPHEENMVGLGEVACDSHQKMSLAGAGLAEDQNPLSVRLVASRPISRQGPQGSLDLAICFLVVLGHIGNMIPGRIDPVEKRRGSFSRRDR